MDFHRPTIRPPYIAKGERHFEAVIRVSNQMAFNKQGARSNQGEP